MARGGSESFKRRVNRGAGTVMPCIILGIAGYSVWVVVDILCAQYLIRETNRSSTAIAIIVIYFLLFIPTWMAYLRFLITLISNPGFIPFGAGRSKSRPTGPLRGHLKDGVKPAVDLKRTPDSRSSDESKSKEISSPTSNGNSPPIATIVTTAEPTLDKAAILSGTLHPPSGLHKFYTKDIFVCDSAGLPIFCPTCWNWKPDRTHHCSEIGRCVRRMDHFCPWMGGVVSETNMKFFLQFGCYAMLSCGYIFAVVIWAIVDQKRYYGVPGNNPDSKDAPNGNFIVAAVLAGMFTLMAFGVLANWGKLSAWNQTTVESLGRQYFIAILLPPANADGTPSHNTTLPTITYPLATSPSNPPDATRPSTKPKRPRKHRHRRHSSTGSHRSRNTSINPRTFAIIPTGHHNPWDLKSRLDNLKTVLGSNYLDWIIPVRYAPCTRHHDPAGDYPWGPALEKLCVENGIEMPKSLRRSS